jgi:hypothetical protein
MTEKISLLLILVLLPAMALTQQIERGVFESHHSEQTIANTISTADLITPVLLREGAAYSQTSSFLSPLSSRSGYAFLSSAILPGLGQAANDHWIKAGVFLAIEAASIYLAIDYQNRGRKGERDYERWADQNWSVVQYANWLIEYHDIHGISNPHIEDLRSMLTGVQAAFDTSVDWQQVDINLLRRAERSSPYITTDDLTANNFSHVLPEYGSQQYYELISKYYQYQAGWRDYNQFHNQLGHTNGLFNQRYFIERTGAYASPLFWEGVERARQFNDEYRTGRNFKMLLIANHVFSAFDAYFTVRLKQNRLKAIPGILPGQHLNMTYSF